MPKILIIDNSVGYTGAFRSILDVTTKLSPKFNFTYLIPKDSSNFKQLQNTNAKVLQYNMLEISRSFTSLLYIPQIIYNTIKIATYIRRNHIDIVHINDLYNMLGVMIKIFRPKIKLVYHVRLLPTSYAGRFYYIWSRLVEKYADRTICVSEAVAQNFSTKAEVIHDAIPITELQLHNLTTLDQIKFIYLANYTRGKGQKAAILAFKKVLRDLPTATLTFYGGTFNKKKNEGYKNDLINIAEEFQIGHAVNFNLFADNPEDEIRSADIVLNFSESESFSMTTLEALAYGTPIIVTDCGGPSEIIEDGVSGILVPVKDISAMANQMIKLAKNSELRAQFKKNGLERVKVKFNINDQVDKLGVIYDGLLNAPSGY